MEVPGRADASPALPGPPAPFPADSAPLYTVGQVADLLGVQPAFLRRLDTQNVVSPARSEGGQRRYSRSEIDHVHTVNGLVGQGITLEGARRIIELQAEVAELRRRIIELGG